MQAKPKPKAKPKTIRPRDETLDSFGAEFEVDRVDIAELALRHKLDETDVIILRLLIENPAIKYTEIGRRVGLNRHAVRARCNKLKFKAAFADYNKGVFDKLFDLQAEAVRELQNLLRNSKDEAVRFRAAKALLYAEPKIMRKMNDAADAGATNTGVPAVVYDMRNATIDKAKGE